MPVHTISPTIDSQGLGITYSTLSPQQYDQSAGPSRPIQTLTGMGVHPRSSPGPSSSHPSQNNHPTHAGQAAPLRAGPPRQSSSQGFASFSDLAPAQAGQRPPGPRRLPSTPQKAPVVDERSQQSQPERAASRAGSVASSKQITRTKSMELFRKFSRSETVAGGRYVPLSGEDDGPVMGQASDNRSEIAPSFQPTPSSIYTTQQTQASGPSQPDLSANVSRTQTQLPVRTSTVSSSATTSGSSEAQSMAKTPSDNTHAFHPRNFPYPPDRALSRASHSQRPLSQMSGPPTAYFMPRSNSQPHSMHSGQQIPEAHLQMGYTSSQLGAPHHDKRASSVASGIHSRNAALFSAEAGGVMLEFSPSGHGMWKEGQEICGAQTGLIPTPHQVQPSRMAFTADDSDIQQMPRSRPWSTSFPSQQEEAPLARPPTLRQHGRSHSDGAAVLARQGTLFHPAGSTKRASQELGVMLGGKKSRRVSQPKLLTPPDLGGEQQVAASQVRLEASKKSKARVEVDVVLERDCVVEGGEVRGRMEVRVTAGKRSAGLRVGAGKIRVLGFEEISPSSRHIFYHHTHDLPLFAHPAHQSGPQSSLFASAPDDEGYCVAAEGSHNLAFNLRLPMNAGAKGSYDPPTNKGPCVKYVVVGSVKIHIPQTGKRSIAHFYRTISILPFLDPGRVLAPHPEPVEARIQKGLGWSLGGEKGKVDLRVALGRKTWISGQKLWCEVGIINNSAKKIKSLSLALLETVQTFVPQPGLDTQRSRNQQVASKYLQQIDSATPEIDACKTHTSRRKLSEEIIEADFASKGAGRVTGKGWWVGVEAGDVGRWDMSLMLPPGLVTIRRSRLMEVVYTLRVTVNGSIYVDMPVELINFLSIDPPPMPSDGVRGANPMVAMHQQHVVSLNGGPYINASRPAHTRILSDGTVQTRRSMDTSGDPAKASSTTLHIDQLLQAGRARAEAEAQGLAGAQLPASSSQYRQRPLSMGSDYAELHDGFNQDHVFPPAKASASGLPSSTSQAHRPGHMRALSYLSTRTAETDGSNNTDHEGPETLKDQDSGGALSEDDDSTDKAMAAARRAQGRQRSLAALGRAMDRAAAADEEEIERAEAVRNNFITEADLLSPMEEKEFNPFGMPTEEEIKLVNDTPSMRAMSTPHPQSTASSRSKMRRPSVIESLKEEPSEEREGSDPDQHIEGGIESLLPGDALEPLIVDHGDEYPDGEGDDTVIQELLAHHSPEVYSDDQRTFPSLSGESGGYDYAEEIEEESDPQLVRSASQPELRKRKSLPRQLPKLSVINPRLSIPNLNRSESHYGGEASDEEDESDDGSREDSQEVPQTEPGLSLDRTRHIANARSVNGSVALSSYSAMTGGSEAESEVGQVLEAIKRNFSIKATGSKDDAETPAETSSDHGPTAESQRYLTVDSISRRGKDDLLNASIKSRSSGRSSYLPPASGLGMRRESSNPPIPSPLRPKQGEDDTPVVRLVKKKSAVNLAVGDAEPGSGNAKVIQKKSSFSFATPKSPIRIRTTSTSASKSPSKTPGGAKSALQNTRRPSVASGISPKSSAPGQMLNVSPRLSEPSGDFGRQSSPASSLRHAIQPDVTPTRHDDTSESEELDVPALAPSLASGSASESGSSDGHALISPPGNTDSHGMLPAIADTLLPKPNGFSKTDLFNDYTIRKKSDQLPSAIVWGTSEHLLHPQVNLLSATIPDDAAAGKGSTYTHRPSLSRASSLTEDHAREYIDDSNSVMSHGSSHSSVLLPGVKSKIAQMESRDEALRKFSVVSALSAHQPRSGSVTSPVPASPVRTPRASEALQYASSAPLGASPKSPTGSGRKSYTTALAPRPSRSTSEDLYSKSTMSPPSITARQQTMPVAPSPVLRAKVSSPSEQEWSPRRAIYGSPPSFSLPELNVIETAGNGINQRMELGDELDPFGLKGRTGSGTGSSGGRPDSRAGGEGSPRLKVRSTLRDSTGSNNTTLTAIESALASVAKYRNIGAGNASPQSMTSRHHSNVPDHGHGSGDSPLQERLPARSSSRGGFITLDTPDGRERSQYFGDLLVREGDGRTRGSRAWSRVTAETEESEGLL